MTLARISLLSFREGASSTEKAAMVDRVRQLTALASRVAGALVAPDLPPNRNGGDVIWRLEFGSDAEYQALIASPEWLAGYTALEADAGFGLAETFTYAPIAVGERGEERRGGLYRMLVLALDDATPDEARLQFEAEMAGMPDYVSTILRWNFSKVTESLGPNRWSYLWEQEFSDLAGFRGEYMAHPYHWGFIDRWYDDDNPARIVKPYLCNSFCTIDAPVMFTRWPRPPAAPFGT